MSIMAKQQTSAPARMDKAALKELQYKQLQAIAKSHGVQANLKRDAIITQLLKKSPNGIRVSRTPSSASRTKVERGNKDAPRAMAAGAREDAGPEDVETASQSVRPRNAFKGPSDKSCLVVDQKIVELVNAAPVLDTKIRDIQALVAMTDKILEEETDLHEHLSCLGSVLDEKFMGKMHGNPYLWAASEAEGKAEMLEQERITNEEESVNPNLPRSKEDRRAGDDDDWSTSRSSSSSQSESEEDGSRRESNASEASSKMSPESEEDVPPYKSKVSGGSAESFAKGQCMVKAGLWRNEDESLMSQPSSSQLQRAPSSGNRSQKRGREEEETEVVHYSHKGDMLPKRLRMWED